MLLQQPEPTSMDAEVARILREPFPREQIGLLPKLTCRDCSRAQGRVCDRHQKGKCATCSNWITGAHTHLSYIGHAAVTDRLLKADPNWSWEPAYRDVDPHVLAAAVASGDPGIVAMVLDNAPARTEATGGMWIKLTVGGVTRLGYGTDDDPGMDHDKKLVSDALRNAAMRFGVALDLWSKEDLGSEDASPTVPAPSPGRQEAIPDPRGGRDWIDEAKVVTDLEALLQIGKDCSAAGDFVGPVRATLLRRRRELEAPAEAAGATQLSSVRQ